LFYVERNMICCCNVMSSCAFEIRLFPPSNLVQPLFPPTFTPNSLHHAEANRFLWRFPSGFLHLMGMIISTFSGTCFPRPRGFSWTRLTFTFADTLRTFGSMQLTSVYPALFLLQTCETQQPMHFVFSWTSCFCYGVQDEYVEVVNDLRADQLFTVIFTLRS
jgi:hypothetical protein